jgi:hypothetical protein
MGLIAYPPVYDAKRIPPVHRAFAKDKRERVRSAKSVYTKEFIKQAKEARERAEEAKRLDEKQEAHRQGLLTFKRRYMPEWARQIVDEMSQKHGVCPGDMARDDRRHKTVKARNEAIYLIKARKPMLSSPQIGNWFDRDHTSILHSIASHSQSAHAPKLVGYDLDNARARNRVRAAKIYPAKKQLGQPEKP